MSNFFPTCTVANGACTVSMTGSRHRAPILELLDQWSRSQVPRVGGGESKTSIQNPEKIPRKQSPKISFPPIWWFGAWWFGVTLCEGQNQTTTNWTAGFSRLRVKVPNFDPRPSEAFESLLGVAKIAGCFDLPAVRGPGNMARPNRAAGKRRQGWGQELWAGSI